MIPLAEKILELVTTRRDVTYVELDRLEGFSGGDMEMSIGNEQASNIVLWQRLTKEAVAALGELRQAKRIHQLPASILSYLVDGATLRLPLAKRAQHYKEPHWMPVCFNPGPAPKNVPKPKRQPPSPHAIACRKAARGFAEING